jgi:hypothetical protein
MSEKYAFAMDDPVALLSRFYHCTDLHIGQLLGSHFYFDFNVPFF